MKVTMVIPSYWTRERSIGWNEVDAIYDHPAPLDSEATLARAIKSIEILSDTDFRLVIIAVATSEDIELKVEKKVADIVTSTSATIGVEVLLFGPSKLKQIHDLFISEDKQEYIELLQLRSYSNIRNGTCLPRSPQRTQRVSKNIYHLISGCITYFLETE